MLFDLQLSSVKLVVAPLMVLADALLLCPVSSSYIGSQLGWGPLQIQSPSAKLLQENALHSQGKRVPQRQRQQMSVVCS